MAPKECCQKYLPGDGIWIGCDAPNAEELCPGKGWYHLECVGITKAQEEMIDRFYCNVCSIRTNLQTTYKIMGEVDLNKSTSTNISDNFDTDSEKSSIISTASSESFVDENEQSNQSFKIKKLHQHEIDHDPEGTNKMMFLVEWEGFPDKEEYTWEYEENLDKCYEIVQSYRSKNKLAPTKLKAIGGAISGKNNNISNWTTLEKVTETAIRFLNHQKYSSKLLVKAFHAGNFVKSRTDALIFILHECHYFCLLWLTNPNKVFISDGANMIMENDVQEKLGSILKTQLIPIPINKLMKVDHCAAAAILSAMEYARGYKNNDLDFKELTFPNFYYGRVISTLYSQKSSAQEGRKDIRPISRSLTCERCKIFKTAKGRGALLSHQRQKCCGSDL